MLTDAKTRPQKKTKNRKSGTREWYGDRQKLESVKLWLITGNLRATAATLDINYTTIREWRYTKWWDELVTDLRTENAFSLSNKLKKVAEKAIEETLDRLDKGDWIYDQKTGQMRRKPVSMRDAAVVANGFLDRQSRIEDKPIEDANTQKVQDRLLTLAETFAKFARGEVIEGTFKEKDAISEEWGEGLPERIGVGEDPSQTEIEGSCEESPSEERGGEARVSFET